MDDINRMTNEDIIETGLINAGIGVFQYTYDTRAFVCNANYKSIYGLPNSYVWTASTFIEIMTPEHRQQAIDINKGLLTGDPAYENYEVLYKINRYDTDEERWIKARGKQVKNEEGEYEKVIGVVIDITEYKKNEVKLEKENRYLNEVVHILPDYVFIKEYGDETVGKYLAINKEVERLMNMKEEDIIGKTDFDVNTYDDAMRFLKTDLECMQLDECVLSEAIIPYLDKEYIYEVNLYTYKNVDEVVSGIIGMGRDVTERRALDKKKEELKEIAEFYAYYDGITKVYNRNYLNINMSRLMALSKDKDGYVILADINNFKLVNDTYGHLIGDQVLIEIANAIKSNCKENTDIIRYGGDEFIIIILEENIVAIKKIIQKIKDQIKENCRENSQLKQYGLDITVAIGIGHINQFESLEKAITYADLKMYENKKELKKFE